FDDFIELKNYCEMQKITFLSTPFDLESIDFLANLGMEFWKIPSGEITNLPYLIKIAKTHKPVIMSTGMSNLDEIQEAFNLLQENGSGEITLLHCTTEYPAPYEDVNLRAMLTLKEKFNTPVGYSDHTIGIEVPVAAVTLGATVIEKHFTLDRNMEGPDHKASLEPHELKAIVSAIRNVELAMGDGVKKPTPSEKKNIAVARKSIVASRNIKKGEVFTEDNLTTKRPGNGISPMRWYEVLGQRAVRDFKEDELIVL
ncbi:MAG TPA: N-acetylneuraminate synthase, partial [Clostridia bacterium]|nr:N-acetylneuraminate synthase [Clostridia bacterium]